MSFLYIGIHQDDILFDAPCTIDNNLTVKSNHDLSLMKPVRVTLSVIIDLTMLDKDAVNRLLGNENMLLIFIAEWLNAYENFKTEFSRTFNSMDDIYKMFINIIYQLKIRGQDDFIDKILNLLKTNPDFYDGLINIIYDKLPDLYNYLNKLNIFTNRTVFSDYSRHEITGIMKTVMSNHILALSMESKNE